MYLDKEGAPFYIGKGTGQRYLPCRHIGRQQPLLSEVVQAIGYENVKVIFLVRNTSQENALYWERYWVEHVGRQNNHTGQLLNLTNGGYGGRGRVISRETRLIISEKLRGRKQSAETSRRKSIAKKGKPNGCLGRPRTEETRKKIADWHKGRRWALGTKRTEEQRRQISERMKERWGRRKLCQNQQTN